ncbi:MAG: peptide ABC transporter substrate-binding protein [Opitutales bacterium]|nr:peptide ABC transporter substrate-binding protein [Opitutales bacterium]
MFKKRFIILCALFLALFLTACGRKERPVDLAVKEGILIIDNGSEPEGLDPHTVTGFPEHRILMALYEGLVIENPDVPGDYLPGVADTWISNPDHSVWTFHIRDNAHWSNGDRLVAEDFVYAHNRILNAELGSEYAEMLYPILNAEAFHDGEISDFSEVGVKALDDSTLQYTLKGPTAYFPQMLMHYTYWPVHRPTIEAFNAFSDRTTNWARPGTLIGNGPFVLKNWVTNQVIEVEANPHYWDAATVKLKGIRFLPIDNRDTAERMFLAGQLHKTDSVPFNKRRHYRDTRSDVFHEDEFFADSYVGVNCRKSPLDDIRVRRALYLAINDQLITESVTFNGDAALCWVPPVIQNYDNSIKRDYDPEMARALLAEAGYPGGEGLRPLDLLIVNTDTNKIVSETYQEMWRSELGVKINVVNEEWKVFLDSLAQGNFDLFTMAWIGDYIDPSTFLGMMTEGNGNNHTGWVNKEYDRLLEESSYIADPDARYKVLGQAEDILMTELPILPSSTNPRVYLLDNRVRGWKSHPIDNHPYKFIYFAPENESESE